MINAKRNLEEKQSLLLDNEADFTKSGSYETAITKGVANHMSKWPSHLFAAFLAATLVFAAFILLSMVTALFCRPIATYTCRRWKNNNFTEFPNIYYVKHSNSTWSAKEFCYIESTARKYPGINIYLINLMPKSPVEINSLTIESEEIEITKNREMIEFLWEKGNNSLEKVVDKSSLTPESKTRRELASLYANVRNVDVTIDDFFKGSMLARVCHELDAKTLEVAAKAYILWNNPGVALNPYDSRYLETLKTYLCKRECKSLTEAAINPEGSIQATGVACQAFIGSLIHEINAHGSLQHLEIIENARQSFCRSSKMCPGLKMLNSSNIDNVVSCPSIYSSDVVPVTQEMFTRVLRKLRLHW